MSVKDAISSYSRGELAPARNDFVQPGTYKNNPDTAMTDGVRHAMLKAQLQMRSKLKNPNAVRKHLRRHHGVADARKSPPAIHARLHMSGLMSQGHGVDSGGNLFHGTTDIGAGTSNFASEAPPMVFELAGYGPHHVRTARGVDFFRKPLGTPVTEDEYLGIKQSKATAELQQDAVESAAKRAEQSAKTASELTHQDLLNQRRDARARYPAGHPERLKAERAVRASRKTGGYREARGAQAHVSNAKKRSDAKKDPAFYGPKNQIPVVSHDELRRRGVLPAGVPNNPPEPMTNRLNEIADLTPSERSRYFAQRNAGVQHAKAIENIRTQRLRPTVPKKVVAQARSRRRRG